MSSLASQPVDQPLKPEDTVRTPSGAFARVVAIFPLSQEALVEWPNGECARFRLKLLRPCP